MTRRQCIPTLAILTFLVGCSEVPVAPIRDMEPSLSMGGAYVPGEQQPVLDAPGVTWAIQPEGAGQNLSQTFTPTENQRLGYLELPVRCAAGALLNIKIRDGLGGAILYESNHVGPTGGPAGPMELFQVFNPAVSSGIKLKRDVTYAFELASVPSGTGVTCGIARGPGVSSYAGGVLYARDLSISPTWAPISRTSGPGDEDLPFITLVR